MSGLVILGDTSGSVTLNAPAVAGSNTVTLPTTGGTIRTTTTPGTVLQVVQGSTYTQTSTTSTSPVATGLYADITPTSSSNKVLVTCCLAIYCQGAGATTYYSLYRGSTNITSPQAFRYESSTSGLMGSAPITFLDSPSTTGAVTYTIYYWVQAGGTGYMSLSGSPSTMILQEIAV